MMLLVAVGPVWRAVDKAYGLPAAVMRQHEHFWGGFTLWDIIMPLFIFMCGAAIPFALGKRLIDGRPTLSYWKHVGQRFLLLWFLGMLCQGQLATLDPLRISPYNNTLQTIAVGYAIGAVVLAFRARIGSWLLWVAPLVLSVIYALMLHSLGDYTRDGNFAQVVEQKLLSFLVPAGSSAFKTWGYTWFLTSFMFGAMTLCGMNAVEILRGAEVKWRKARKLFVMGALLLAVGWALSPVVPVIKHVFTLSFTAQAMGWSVLALDGLYVITDIWKFRKGWGLVLLYGQFALWAYMINGFFGKGVCAVTDIVTKGFPMLFGARLSIVLDSVVSVAFVTFCLSVRYQLNQKPGLKA